MIQINHKEGYFKYVYTDDNTMALTSWKDDESIENFSYSDALYVPEKWDDEKILSTYREIKFSRAKELEELQKEELERKRREENNQQINNI